MSTKVDTLLIEPGTATTGQVLTYDATTNRWSPQTPPNNVGDDCPIGTIMFFAASTAPTGWLVCDGNNYAPADYPDLYSLIGTIYGPLVGSNFRVPDLRGEFIRGWAGTGTVDANRPFGSRQGEMVGPHTHTMNGYLISLVRGGTRTICDDSGGASESSKDTTENTGIETRPRNVALLPCIKATKTLAGSGAILNFIVKPTSPTNGQILSYNGSNWVAITAPTGLPGTATGGQVLTYNGSTSTWVASASPASVKSTSSFTIDGSMLAKAWVNFDGTGTTGANQTIRSSYNVDRVYKNTTGYYTVVFKTPFENNSYVVNGIAGGNISGSNYNNAISVISNEVSPLSCQIRSDDAAGDAQDSDTMCATFFASGGNLTGTANVFDTTPVGTVTYFAASAAPMGYMICNGSVLSRAVYPDLFAVIGTIYNTGGEGVANFRLPNLLGEFIRGWDNSRGIDADRAFGSYQADELKSHTHTYSTKGGTAPQSGNATQCWIGDSTANTGTTGGSETRPRNVALLPCIKVQRTVTGDTSIINYITNPASASDGQVLSYNGTTGRWVAVNNTASLPSGTNGQVLTYNGSTSTWVASAAPISSSINAVTIAGSTVILQDQKPSGTSGGNSSSGTWMKRTLNTKVSDLGGLCDLNGSSQFSLLAGTYTIDASAPCYRGDKHRIRLFNVSDNSITCYGTNEFTSGLAHTKSFINHIFTIPSTKTFEIQHYITTGETDGLGVAISQGTEIYTHVEITKSVGLSAAPPVVDSTPIGTVSWFAASAVPMSYLQCNGSIVSKSVYSDLFAIIGTRYNTGGEGGANFRLPDLRGEFIRGWDNGRGVDAGRILGSFQAGEIVSHDHPSIGTTTIISQYLGSEFGNTIEIPSSGSTGSTGGTETRPRNVALLPCIKALQTVLGATPLNFISKPLNPKDGQTLVYREASGQWEAGTSTGSSIGASQTYQDVTSSRVKGTTYTNNTSKPILVCVSGGTTSGANVTMIYTVDGIRIGEGNGDSTNGGAVYPFSFIVPVGSTYSVGGTRNVGRWVELR